MLKYIRVTLAVISIVAVTLLFVDFTGFASAHWGWMAQIQLVPAVLSANLLALAFLAVLTLVFGRVYCSVICPLGILQDVANWMRGHVGKKKNRINRFKYAPAWRKTRLVVLTIFVVLLILGAFSILSASIASLIAPYSAYGRIASQIFSPAYDGINNLLASWSESQVDNYAFYRVVAMVSAPVLAVAIITLAVVVVMAWRGGRDYCNTICPVGTVLGYLAQYSLLKPVIDTDKCIDCGKCARNCKAKCIDSKQHNIDYTRCVVCMDCINKCSTGAISYTWRRAATKPAEEPAPEAAPQAAEAVSNGRRGFILAAGMLAASAAMGAVEKTTDGGFAPLKPKKPAQRAKKVVPPGAKGYHHFSAHCTACQLCIQACPSGVLKPTTTLEGFMQPQMDFTDGYCSVTCTKCSEVCPTNAIDLVTAPEKTSIKIGTAVVDPDLCLAATEGENCGSCAAHCPVNAIVMVEADGKQRPAVNEEACLGCGACEWHCPVGTVVGMKGEKSAIHVEGIDRHREI